MLKLDEPDSGYAWVIAFSACIINMILSGMARMIGILYVAIIEAYNVSRQEASVPFTVRNAIRDLSGPIVGVLGQRFGIRTVTFFGGLIASIGSLLCCIAPTVTWISVFWGGIHGLGFSLGNTLFVVVVNQYFEKYRATASGIVLSGACVGSFAFPIMLESILNQYGLFGCFLILGGIFLNVMPPSLVLKSPPWLEDPEEYARQRALVYGYEAPEAAAEVARTEQVNEEDENGGKQLRSMSNCSMNALDIYNMSSASVRKSSLSKGRELRLSPCKLSEDESNVVCISYQTTNTLSLQENPTFQTNKDILANKKASVCYINTDNPDKNREGKTESSVEKRTSKSPNSKNSFWGIVKNIALLYKNPIYILISLCMAVYLWIFIPVLTVVVDYSRDKGIKESDGKYLIHALTVGDLVGRLCFGWVTDKGVLSFPVFMAVTYVLQGLFISLLPFALSLWMYMAVLALYGVTAGIIFVYFPVLVHKYVDEENQPIAIGCVGLLSGVVTFGIPSSIGHFRDNVGSYDGLFYIIGLISIVTGCLWLLETFFLRIRKRQNGGGKENI